MILSLNETRVLGVLCEKQRTVPDSYPMTLNSLLSGCNQKTSRDPVLELTESDVLAALDGLREHSLIIEQSGSRVARYAHNLERVLQIPTQSSAILTALMLRGPQTAAELRTNCERLHKFADISALEAFLAELSERSAGALVVELPRQPGARENRWMHLLSGEVDLSQFAAGSAVAAADPALKTRVEELEAEVTTLKNQLAHLARELGVSLPE
jgi:uncharacterized protein YceH (UPF0502 family)